MKLRNTKEETPAYLKRESNKNTAKKEKPKNNIHVGHRERLKKQYITNGAHTMTDIQQLELLLFYAIPQKDTNPIAHALLTKFGNIKNVLNANVRDLCTVEGIKESTATFLKLVSNMATICSAPKEGETIGSTKAAKSFCSKFYVGVTLEQFHVVCLSKNNKVLGTKMIRSGTVDEIKIDIRDITEFAFSLNCNRIIISHNHPEGNCTMSDEDCRFTYSLICSCLLNSIEILDHIIVSNSGSFSMNEHLLIEKLVKRAKDNILITSGRQVFISSDSKPYERSEEFDDYADIKF